MARVSIPKSSLSKPANLQSTRIWRVLLVVRVVDSTVPKAISFGPVPGSFNYAGTFLILDFLHFTTNPDDCKGS